MEGAEGDTPLDSRRAMRVRKVAPKVAAVLVDRGTRQRATVARLEALENDNVGFDFVDDDEAFIPDAEEALFLTSPKASKGGKRKTRHSKGGSRKAGAKQNRVIKTFAELLQEDALGDGSDAGPNYITADVGPPCVGASRKFCSVCGFVAPYTCTKCGSRFCSCKCKTVHNDTRCLKFVA